MSEEKTELSTSDQLVNALLGADFLLRIILSIPWMLQMWYVQAQQAKANGERWFPQLPKSLWFYDASGTAQNILNAYHVHNMHFGTHLEMVGNQTELIHAVLVPATQYDYADAILHQHGVSVVSEPGAKRGYTMRPPRDYERRPAQRTQAKSKLGKTYS